MSHRPVRVAASVLFVIVFLAAACEPSRVVVSTSASASPAPTVRESPSPVPTGPGSAAAAMKQLCDYGPPPGSAPVPPEGTAPQAIVAVEKDVEQLRELRFTEPVVADPVTQAGMVKDLQASFDYSYPRDLLARRTRAWQTMGVIPPGTSIRADLEVFASGQVIGYYDTLTGELVFIGSENPNPYERVTLAHELTHALDDQHFGLERLDQLMTTCHDEAGAAAVALTEGDATNVMTRYALQDLTPQEQLQLATEAQAADGGTTTDVAPFIQSQQLWPYTAGQRFVQALFASGGNDAVDRAFLDPPVSTEQIIHPDRYPNDMPTPVDIPDLGPALGTGWTDLDVQEVGEEWLSLALQLRLDQQRSAGAADGWDGGIYRAWSNGDRVAVALSTVWDTPQDASDFADAMTAWIAAAPGGQVATVLPTDGTSVRVLFASDAETLTALEAAT